MEAASMAMAGLVEERDLWKNKLRALQIRVRGRLRVTVDKHQLRQRFIDKRQRISDRISDGYFSSKMQQWLLRFRKLRRDALPPTYKFYRKRVSKDMATADESILMQVIQALAVPVFGNVCHVFMRGFNHVQIYGVEKLHEAVLRRPEGKPLITVSNHVASVDDPFVIASLLPPSVMLDARNLRWTLCASDRCFKNPAASAFFKSVKVLPVSRGDGIYQKGMDLAMSKLNNGGWVHIFPEGSRSRDGGRTMGSIKRGVGRLVLDADKVPIVVPFVHSGMQEIMPIGAKFPKIGKMVTVLIGDPIHLDDLIKAEEDKFIPRGELYDAIASRIGERLHDLKVQVDELALEQALNVKDYTVRDGEHAADILQQVDWEAFGMRYVLAGDDSPVEMANKSLPKLNVDHAERPTTGSSVHFGVNFPHNGGIMSRVRGYMHPTDLMGFAARSLFLNTSIQQGTQNNVRPVGPLKAWKEYFEASLFPQWNSQ